jgi:hypothetical protein
MNCGHASSYSQNAEMVGYIPGVPKFYLGHLLFVAASPLLQINFFECMGLLQDHSSFPSGRAEDC